MTDSSIAVLFGLSDDHVVDFECGIKVHEGIVKPLSALRRCAAKEGIDLAIASGFRSYHRQKTIFDEKWLGVRNVVSDDDSLLDRQEFEDPVWLGRILRFSALPGTSRHHWGTDIDVFDKAVLETGERPALLPSEYQSTGVFSHLGGWLQHVMERDDAEGFFRPYEVDSGGVAIEPWHLSFRPIAENYADQVSAKALRELWSSHPALQPEGYPLISDRLDQLFDRYVS